MKIKHEYDDGPEYLTKGKVYKAIKKAEDLLLIKDDKGDFIVVYLPYCAHLDDRPWTIIED